MKTPRAYQEYAINRAAQQSILIADACGLGKTLEAIEAVKKIQETIAKPVLIVAPNETVKLQWLRELQDQGIDNIFWLDSKPKAINDLDVFLQQAPTGAILTHYEAVVKYQTVLSSIYFAAIVADEAHRIKNRKAKRTEAIKQLRAYRKIALTGTPYDKNPADAWSILNWIDPHFFTSYWRFFEAHVAYRERIVHRTQKIKEILPSPLKDPANFARTMRPYMLQRKKEDVRSDLPERIDQYVDLEMSKAQRAIYKKLAEADDPIVDLGDGLETSASIVLTQILREIQITTDPALLGALSVPSVKLEWLASWLEDNPNESVIIFTRFRGTAEKIHSTMVPNAKLIVGGKRPPISSDDRVIVGTIAAMGEGLDLPHIDHAIFLDVEWSSIQMQQAIDRIHRINITNAKHLYFLRCVDTVDALVHMAIREKWTTKELAEHYLNGRDKK